SGVVIPYYNPTGEVVIEKRRTALSAKKGSLWPKGSRLIAYGQERLADARLSGVLVLAEGESDAWTLWFHGIPTLGIPGAGAAGTLELNHLEGIEKLYVIHEPDSGGAKFVGGVVARLQKLGWSGEAFEVLFSNKSKDPNDLHRLDPEGFARSNDGYRRDAFYRFNQSFQHFFDSSAKIDTKFA
ncbi:MAG: hypothetical protein IH797_05925, partial [Chloroflexi bacterium]|nr:hypothetical protein [Chloroflexota bacterium]